MQARTEAQLNAARRETTRIANKTHSRVVKLGERMPVITYTAEQFAAMQRARDEAKNAEAVAA